MQVTRDFYNFANFLLFKQRQYYSERRQHRGFNNNLEFRFFCFFDFVLPRYVESLLCNLIHSIYFGKEKPFVTLFMYTLI